MELWYLSSLIPRPTPMQLFKSDAEKREEGLVMRLVFFLASVQALSCQRFPPHLPYPDIRERAWIEASVFLCGNTAATISPNHCWLRAKIHKYFQFASGLLFMVSYSGKVSCEKTSKTSNFAALYLSSKVFSVIA